MIRKSYQVKLIPAAQMPPQAPPYQDTYTVKLIDGSGLELPLQPFPNGQGAIALLMSNQTSFAVEEAIAPMLTKLAKTFEPEAIAGIPTLGLDYARLVARQLGFPHYVALGNSRKFWYDQALSIPVVSVTSPDAQKSLYLDPALVERVAGQRTLVVDDVINTGTTAVAAIRLLEQAGANVVGLVVVLTEGYQWQDCLGSLASDWTQKVRGLGHIPLFERVEEGWQPILDTLSNEP